MTRMDVREKLIEIVKKAAYSSLPSNTEDFHLNMFVTNLLSHGVTVQEWISVDDRLPDYFTSVLVWCPGNKCIYAAYRNARQEWYTFDDTIAGHVVVNMVTHWMPMPEPPEAALKGGEG